MGELVTRFVGETAGLEKARDTARRSLKEVREEVKGGAEETKKATTATERYAGRIRDAGEASGRAARSVRELTQSQRDGASQAERAASGYSRMTSSLRSLQGATGELRALAAASGRSAEAEERARTAQLAANQARAAGVGVNSRLGQEIRKEVEEQARLRAEIERTTTARRAQQEIVGKIDGLRRAVAEERELAAVNGKSAEEFYRVADAIKARNAALALGEHATEEQIAETKRLTLELERLRRAESKPGPAPGGPTPPPGPTPAAGSGDADTPQTLAQKWGAFAAKLAVVTAAYMVVKRAMGAVTQAAREQEEANAQVEAAVLSTGKAAGISAEELGKMAGQLMNATAVDDAAIGKMQSVLLTFGNVQGDVFVKAQTQALNLSRRMGGDLSGAAVQLGKALNDPIQGVSALQRVGISFDDTQKRQIKNLVQTNQLAKAQGIILAELEKEVGGAAAAYRDTLGGSLDNLKNQWGELLEAIGGQSGTGNAVKFWADKAAAALQWVTEHWSLFAAAVDLALGDIVRGAGIMAAAVIESVAKLFTWLHDRALALQVGLQSMAKAMPDIPGLGAVRDRLNEAANAVAPVVSGLNDVRNSAHGMAEGIRQSSGDLADAFGDKAEAHVEAYVAGLEELNKTFKGTGVAARAATDEQIKAQKALDDYLESLRRKTSELQRELEAERRGALAAEEVRNQIERENAVREQAHKLLEQGLVLSKKDVDAILSEIEKHQELSKAIDVEREARERNNNVRQALAASQAENENLRRKIDLLEQGRVAQNRYADTLAAVQKALALGLAPWSKEFQLLVAIETQNAALARSYDVLSEARDKSISAAHQRDVAEIEADQQRQRDLEARAVEIADHIREPLEDAWRSSGQIGMQVLGDLATGTKVNFESLVESLKNMWIRAILEMVARWITGQKLMQAEAIKTGAINAAASSAGGGGKSGGGGMWQSIGGAFFGNTSMGSAIMGNPMTGGSGFGGAVGAGIFAVVAAIVIHWLDTKGTSWAKTQIQFGGSQGIGIGSGTMENQGASASNNGKNAAQVLAGAFGVIKAVQDFLRQLGGEIDLTQGITGSMSVTKRGQGKNSKWIVQTVDGIIKNFGRDMEAALEYATIQAIKATPSYGLPEEVRQAIQNTTAEKMEQFNKDIATAMSVLHARLGGTGSQVYDTVSKYNQEIAAAQALRLNTDALVAARNREVEATRNGLLGVDNSTADFLASLASFQAGVAEAGRGVRETAERNLAAAREALDNLAAGNGPTERPDGSPFPAGIGDNIERQRRLLQERVDRYVDELEKIPKALSDQELNMAIFDSLYKYLQGSGKYGAQALQYAKLKVELEFAAIKAQLVALGKWEQFAGLFNDAYAAALAAAGKPAGGAGRGAGSNREEQRQQIRATAAGWGKGSVESGLDAAQKQFDDFKDSLRGLGFSAAEQAELLRLAGEELARQQAEIKKGVMDRSAEFIARGTAKGGPLASALGDIDTTAQGLIADTRALARSGQLTTSEMRKLNAQIRDAAAAQREAAVKDYGNNLLFDLYGILGMDKEAAQLKYELTVAELQIRREELALAIQKHGLDGRVLGTIDGLLSRIIGHPELFAPGTTPPADPPGGGGGVEGPNQFERRQAVIDEIRQQAAEWANPTNGATGPNAELAALAARLEELRRAASEAGVGIWEINALVDANQAAINRLWNGLKQTLADFLNEMRTGGLGELSGGSPLHNMQASQAAFAQLLQRAQGGDADAYGQLPDAARALLESARGFYGGADSGAYRALFNWIQQALGQLAYSGPGAVAPPAATTPGGSNLAAGIPAPILGGADRFRGDAAPIAQLPAPKLDAAPIREAVAPLVDRIERLEELLEELVGQTGEGNTDRKSLLEIEQGKRGAPILVGRRGFR